MEIKTILLIILAAIAALGMVIFQYYYKSKKRGRLSLVLSFLRFLGIFGLFLLIINPKFSKNEYTIEKTNLVVLTDNSSSMFDSRNQVNSLLEKISTDAPLTDKFDLQNYQFATSLKESDSLSFDEKNTNITKALAATKDIYGNSKSVVLLLTDGNQTLGADYGFQGNALKFPVYPIAVGDTTQYEDLRIDQVNVNKYAFLKNKYPIEVYVSYQGTAAVTSNLTVAINGRTAYKERVNLSSDNGSKRISTVLDAASVGVKSVSVRLEPLDNERNTVNNQKKVAVEVIDEKTNVAIISDILHPDIGALTKAIESNEQRSVSLKKSNSKPKDIEDVDVFILYQPTASFSSIFEYVQQKKASNFIVGGNKTDWAFINRVSNNIQIEDGYPNQEIFPVLNPSFAKFDITDFSVEDFPPLESDAGNTVIGGDSDVLMTMMIRGAQLKSPLMVAREEQGTKQLILLGENIWKWRMQSYRNQQSFENFDAFIGKLILYLSTNKSKNRLNVDYDRIYDGSGAMKISATYFDEAFVFDANASISLQVKSEETTLSREIPMLLKNNFYEADLLGLPAGAYKFTVMVKNENRSKSGAFTILDFDVEQQLFTTDYKKLDRLASATEGRLYFSGQIDSLLSELKGSNQFLPTQKSTKNVVSLIDFRILMALIAAALALEWFIRKYNGLI